nr:MAG TPA: hypothetical protein [Caudoviricetes sp.]
MKGPLQSSVLRNQAAACKPPNRTEHPRAFERRGRERESKGLWQATWKRAFSR